MCTVEKIHQRQMEKVEEIKDLLGCKSDDAILILRYFKWDVDKLQNNWFEKMDKLKLQIGLEFDTGIPKKAAYVSASLKSLNQGMCQICYSDFDQGTRKADSMSCGHQFCSGDWKDWLI